MVLSDLVEIIGGGTPKTSEKSYWNGNIPWLSVKDFCGDIKYVYKTEKSITEKGLNNSSTKILRKDNIIISARGTVGETAMIPYEMAFNQSCFGLIAKGNNDPHFIYYLLKDKVRSLRSQAQGSVFDTITKSTFDQVECENYSIPKQHRIASLLSSLDRKIETNNKINAQLEEMAQAIFKNWFVDFEPFKDGKFVDSELGKIPEGWKVGTLNEITQNKSDKVKERNDVKVLSPITTGELVLSEDYFSKQVFSSSIAKYKIVEIEDFAYNPARVNIGSIGRNEFDFVGCVSPVYVVFSVKDEYANFLDLFRKRKYFKTSVASLAIGGVRQSLSYDDLSSIETIIPDKNTMERFNDLYEQIKSTIKVNKKENQHLSHLRDTLLPKLMSGEIEIPE